MKVCPLFRAGRTKKHLTYSKKTLPIFEEFPSFVRSSDRTSGSKIEDGGLFVLRGRKSKTEDGKFSRTCLAWIRFTETNRRRSTGQHPGTKSAFRPADKPLVQCRSNAGFVPSVYIGFPLFVLLKNRSGQVCSIRCLGGCESRLSPRRTDPSVSRPARPRPAPPSRRAPPRPDPPVVRSSFRLDKFC